MISNLISWPAGIDESAQFLTEYWQKQPLFMPSAVDFSPPLSGDELAGLALEDDVECELIFTHRSSQGIRYEIQHGPFSEADFARLGPRDWTLLIHDVEKHLPDLRALLTPFAFIPAWRRDDLMVSFAAPGGSVGAHCDSYDVFLLQGEGERAWSLASAGSGKAAHDSPLRLIENADFTQSFDTQCGDILYLPPGVVHHGVATSVTSTWSIGMQAPLLSDIAALSDCHIVAADDARYADPDLTMSEASSAGLIDTKTALRLGVAPDEHDRVLEAVGILSSQCKPALRPPPPNRDDFEAAQRLLSNGQALDVHPMSKILWSQHTGHIVVYGNGESMHFAASLAPSISALCATQQWRSSPTQAQSTLFEWLFGIGIFSF